MRQNDNFIIQNRYGMENSFVQFDPTPCSSFHVNSARLVSKNFSHVIPFSFQVFIVGVDLFDVSVPFAQLSLDLVQGRLTSALAILASTKSFSILLSCS